MPTTVEPLLSPDFMARLERLDIACKKILRGRLKGERRSKRRGQSIEFADYRNYTIGDDLRFIDWNVYARLDKLFLKLFLEEEDLAVNVLIDTSGSGDYGTPNKHRYMCQVAAAIGYIGLVNQHRVHIAALSDTINADTGPMRSRRRVPKLMEFLESLKPAGKTNFAVACKRYALQHRGRGVTVVLSDFFDKNGFQGGLRYLATAGVDFFAIQVLSPQEIEPDLKGDLRLVDLEDDDAADVSINATLLKQYKNNLDAYCAEVKEWVTRRGGSYLFASSAVPFETLILKVLRERGLFA